MNLAGVTVGKPYPKAGETRNLFCAGFEFLPIRNGESILLKGHFMDESGQAFNTAFGST